MNSNVWYVPSFKKKWLYLVLIQQERNQIIMENGLVKINSAKEIFKIIMTGYEDGKNLRMKGRFAAKKKIFAVVIDSGISSIK
jgi:hypothetical protein